MWRWRSKDIILHYSLQKGGNENKKESTTVQSWLITRLASDSESQRTVNLIALYTQSKYKFPENHQFNEASISVWILKSCRLKTQTCTTIQPLLTPHCCSGPQSFLPGKSHGLKVALALQQVTCCTCSSNMDIASTDCENNSIVQNWNGCREFKYFQSANYKKSWFLKMVSILKVEILFGKPTFIAKEANTWSLLTCYLK